MQHANCNVTDYFQASTGLAGGSYICTHQMATSVRTVTLVQLTLCINTV